MRLVTVAFVVLLGGAALAWASVAVRPSGARLDAGCHVLMSLGMAGMLLAML
ncbi:hypothetical protein [Pseudonocardia adelaidensis]|uniref:hypothetical protein n=1 Tax=Pseudonocardia adelaidensis TaxID=648754 RepID=UPI003CD0BB88